MAHTKSVAFELDEEPSDQSIFQQALDEWLKSRSKKSKRPQFIADLKSSKRPYTQKDVQDAIKQVEKEHTDKTSTMIIRKTLRPVIRVLTDYASVVDTLAQADPMPTSLIWGSLRAVISISTRFLELYETISSQLKNIENHISLLIEYADLFEDSQLMRARLKITYIYIIQFWYRVEKECKRCVANRLFRSLASFSTSKLDDIVNKIEHAANEVDKLVPVVQERCARGEREDAAAERIKAGISRKQLDDVHSLMLQNEKEKRLNYVRRWLQAEKIFESNLRRHQEHREQRKDHTCEWLATNNEFNSWLDSRGTEATIWVKAAPGFGKSVTCAFALEEVSTLKPCSACVYQYYSFDEQFEPVEVYRSLASQLISRLWTQKNDIPEEIYTYAQRSEFCLDVKDSQNMIKLLVHQLNDVFIFLDGLDEECNSSTRRSDDLAGVITFLSELTLQSSAMVHLWCSSQDKAMLRAKLGQFPSIEITGDTNGADIKVFLSKGITQLDSEDFDEGYKNLILEDLTEKTQGCFLWAAGMLASIRHAESLDEVKQKIKDSLPEKIEDYYMQKLRRLDEAQRPSVALILSCIAFARRPLRLEELREITGVARIDDGQDALDDQKMFGKIIMKYCDQLVRVTETEFENRKMTTCTLWHSTVRAFLTKYPEVLCTDQFDLRRSTRISEEMIANVCLKFLWQPSFKRLLHKKGDSFKNANNKDIKDQPLISYAAKYWDKHLDDVVGHLDIGGCENTDSFCFRVQRFIHSPQFITCIQIQSLLVKGQFQFWWDAHAQWRGPQIKRIFPRWLAGECLPTLTREYAFFIGEWGEFLDDIASDTGPVPGEVDRCFWGSLGPWHFLRGTASRYNSFMLSKDHQAMYEGYLRYYDGFNNEGDEAVLLTLDNESYGQGRLRVQCQHWKLRDSTFEPGSAQELYVNPVSFRMYDLPLKGKHIGRAPPVSLSQDLGCLRIGSDVFIRSAAGTFQRLQREGQDGYTEDVVYRHGLVALSRRNEISEEDLPDIIRTMDETSDSNDKSEFFAELSRKLGITMIDSENTDESSSSLDQDWSTGKTDTESATATSLLSMTSSVKESLSEQEADGSMNGDISPVLDATIEKSDDESEFALEAASIESVSNSATTVWSESSSRAESDIDEAVDWNDWDDRDNDLIDVESASDNESASDQEGEDMVDSDPGTGSGSEDEGIEIGSTGMKLIYHMGLLGEFDSNGRDGDGEDGEDDDGSEAASVQSRFSEEYFTGESDSDLSSEEGQRLDRLLKGEPDSKSDKKLTRIRLDVYDTDPKASDPVFRFSHKTRGALYSSPPVFHPSKRLLVWPLGDEQILFADVDNNSYFTRLLGCSSLNSCHVFVKAHFSADGRHLHFAALEAGPVEVSIQKGKQSKDAQALRFNMQITTHRLSERKTTRAPPRLIHRVNLPLGRATRINVSDLPYELTWREKEVYITIRDEVVRVARVPLFPSFSNGSLSERDTPVVTYNEKLVYLPRTAPFRSVRYFPPPTSSSVPPPPTRTTTSNKSSSKQEKEGEEQEQGEPNHSLLILGSNCTTIAKRRLVARVQVSPPVGVWLDQDEDLGEWRPRLNKDVDEELREKTARKTAGKLSDMWEKFDRTDDCDIVPYLY